VAVAGLLLAGVVALGLVGLRIAHSPGATLELAPGAIAGYNVLLVTLDTLRSDRVGCYGYRGAETPVLDALAAAGVRFADVVSPVPMTLPAHASILTGDYPPRHGVRDNGTYRLTGDHETLAERLKAQGYATAAFIGAFVLDRRYGRPGFDTYTTSSLQGATPTSSPAQPGTPRRQVMRHAGMVRRGGRTRSSNPYFIWVHLYDPHTLPPEPYQRSRPRPVRRRIAGPTTSQRLLDALVLAEHWTGRWWWWYDHGGGLGDHGESTHSLLIYESAMNVPLLLYAPQSIRRPAVVADRVVSVVDIVPTILDGLGLPAGGHDGVSLLRHPPEERVLYMETLAPRLNHGWSALYGVRRGRLKYIQAPTPELYDLDADPREARNLASARHDAALARDSDRRPMPIGSLAVVEWTGRGASWRRWATSAGAASTGAQSQFAPRLVMIDASTPTCGERADRGQAGERTPGALLAARRRQPVVDVEPGPGAGGATTRRSPATARWAQPNDAGAVQLATLQEASGDLAGSAASLTEAERLEPELGSVCIVRAMQALHAGRYDEALQWAQEARRRDPTRFTSDSLVVEGGVREAMARPGEE
jgi:hypothetical protein